MSVARCGVAVGSKGAADSKRVVMRMARAFAAALAHVLFCAGNARADESAASPVELVWEAPPGCPTKGDVLASVAEILGAGGPTSVHMTAHGALTRIGKDSFRLVLETRATEVASVRTLEAVSCAALAKAAAVVITTTLGELPSVEPPPSASPTAPSTPTPSSASAPSGALPPSALPASNGPQARRSPAPSAVPARARRPMRDRLTFVLAAAPTLDVGTLPDPAVGGALTVAADYRWLRAGLTGSAYFPQGVTFEEPLHATGRFRLATAGAFGCALFGSWRARLGPCAGIGMSFVEAAGLGIPNAKAVSLAVSTATGGGLAALDLATHFAVFARLDAAFPLHTQQIGVRTATGAVALHELAIPAFRGAVGVEIRLP